jgi:hypothetical protein
MRSLRPERLNPLFQRFIATNTRFVEPIPKSTEDPMNRRENGAGRAARRRGLWTAVSLTFLDEIRPSVSFGDSGRQT